MSQTLSDYLQSRHLLLLLDNCEHMLAACATLVDSLLKACPHLHVLATSRTALGIADERAWIVPSLSLPPVEPAAPGADYRSPFAPDLTHLDIEPFDAVRLFIERAASVLPSFVLTPQNGPTVVQVCRRLDGIPLAIELAAARVKLLTVAQIATRLENACQLLTRGSPTTLARHQTLRAAIDWSYDLLSEKERRLFERLSVFAGGFSLDAAEQVCASDELDSREILDLLSDLSDKSLLVVAERKPGSEARFRLLETIRQFGLEKLAQTDESQRWHGRHLQWSWRASRSLSHTAIQLRASQPILCMPGRCHPREPHGSNRLQSVSAYRGLILL